MTLYYPPTQNGLQKSLDAQLDEGAISSLTLNNTTGVQNKPGVIVINRIDANGEPKESNFREWIKYTGVSGNTLTGLTRAVGGSSDQDHAVSSIVEFIPDISVFQAILDVLDGTSTGANLNAPVLNGNLTGTGIVDEDDMSSNSATKIPTQQSVKAYVDANTGGAMTDETGYVRPTTAGDDIRSYDGDGDDYIEINHDGTDAGMTTNKGHIELVPASSKLVKIAVLEQNDTSNTYRNNSVILTGWGYYQINNASSTGTETVTFGITFANKPIVVTSSIGSVIGSVTDQGSFTSSTAGTGLVTAQDVSSISTTTFVASTKLSGNVGANAQYGYAWIAIGVLT